MKKFILKIGLYFICIFIGLELLVRVFHLHKDRPVRYLDEYNVEKWIPNQTGIWVTGNRRQNVGEYKINNFGYNSVYDEFQPKKNKKEIALVGDSFIQGFHQNYQNSIGQKLETKLNKNYKVLEFGYAGWDLADQLHMIKAYEHLFDDIEHVVIYMQYTTDLKRDTYTISDRFSLDTPLNRFLKEIKTVVYLRDLGLMDPITKSIEKIKTVINGDRSVKEVENVNQEKEDRLKLENFKQLVKQYGYDKHKNVLLLDYSLCSTQFLDYLEQNQFKTINFNKSFEVSKTPPTLIYDQHWNNHGRNLITNLLEEYIQNH
ncbi:hypothetical protein [uncultured Algibacter sp.]|uniref:hypothetical protein n=1 Tax=uncultured Algibacter sp. TaxID=298659 RepID=UPI002630D289|nr:hypothetical protein [uncultured Algibacter sp.]